MSYSSRRGRDIDGIILLDKPLGFSSNDLLQKVKRLFRANKAGHTGALDPLATGMLPICFGEATKFANYLLDANKRYLVTARLGKRTDTSDVDGQTICIRPVSLEQAQLETVLDYFRGESRQIPSMFSALKYKGRPLYEYARKGITIARNARLIHVYDLHMHHWDLTQLVLEIYCSKGTYIRTIIDDLGERLGCGAHVTSLRRLSVAHYATDSMITFALLQNIAAVAPDTPETLARLDALLLPMDSMMLNMPAINLPSDIAKRIWLGQPVVVTAYPQVGFVRLIEEGNIRRFFGIGEIVAPDLLMPHRLITKTRL